MMKDIEIKISRETRMVDLSKSIIGNDSENLQGRLVFSFTDKFVSGQARLEFKTKNNEKAYILLERDEESYVTPIKSVLTKNGQIDMQLVITEGTNENEIPIFKSNVFYMKINPSINAEIEQPDEYPQWIDIANSKLNEIENLDIDVTKTDDVSTVTITKKDGITKSVEIKDAKINGHNTIEIIEGKNINLEQKGNQLKISSIGGSGGVSDYNELDNKPKINDTELKGNLTNEDLGIKNGADGKDGISVTHSWNGTVLTITSASGTSSSDLKGDTGENGTNGVDGKNYSVEVVESTTTTLEIQPNKFYKFGEVTELNLALAEITDTKQLNEFMFEFVSGATATTLTLPSSVKWLETPTIEANKIYQCSIVDNIGVLLGVSNV